MHVVKVKNNAHVLPSDWLSCAGQLQAQKIVAGIKAVQTHKILSTVPVVVLYTKNGFTRCIVGGAYMRGLLSADGVHNSTMCNGAHIL